LIGVRYMDFGTDWEKWYCEKHEDPFPIMCSTGKRIDERCRTCTIARDYTRWKNGFYDGWRNMSKYELMSIEEKTRRNLERQRREENGIWLE